MANRKTLRPEKMNWGTRRELLAQALIVLFVASVWLALLLVLVMGQEPPLEIEIAAAGAVTWDDVIGPWLAEGCVVCHGGTSGLHLDTYENTLKGGRRGQAVIPGDGEGSLLVQSLRGNYPGLARMPLSRPPLSDDEVIGIISAWIDVGAPKTASDIVKPTTKPTSIPTWTPSVTPTPPPETARATVGAELWLTLPCSGCHGEMAQGGIGPTLAGTELSLETVLLWIRTGKDPMPAYTEEQVSDLQVRHLYAWLRSLVPPTLTPTSVTPTPPPETARATVGAELWPNLSCSGCHGELAQGGIDPRLAGTELSLEALLLLVRTGTDSMPAYTEEQVSDLEVRHIYAYRHACSYGYTHPHRHARSCGHTCSHRNAFAHSNTSSDGYTRPDRHAGTDEYSYGYAPAYRHPAANRHATTH
jgi:mono/diheme cytochrome c family protein